MEDGSNRPHVRLYSEVVAEEPGYFYIYPPEADRLCPTTIPKGEKPSLPAEGSFDDFGIMNLESYIVQQTDYHPYGLVVRNFVRAGEKESWTSFRRGERKETVRWTVLARSRDAGRVR